MTTNLKDSALITFRVTPEEKKALKIVAASCDMSIRELLHEALMMKLTSFSSSQESLPEQLSFLE